MPITITDVDESPNAWREAGEGPRVAVLLHGLGGSRIAWGPNLPVLAEAERVVAWDAPGYGESAPVEVQSFAGYADRAAALIHRVSPDAPVDLVGTSFGGMIAQYMTHAHPELVRSLTLICTSPAFGLDGTDPDEWRNNRLKGLETFGTVAAAAPVILSSLAGPEAQHVVPEACEAMARIPMAGMLTSLSILPSHDSRAILTEITVPTLVLIGEDDDETPPSYSKAIVDLMPNATLVTIPGAGHLLNLEAPDAVNRAILQHWETT